MKSKKKRIIAYGEIILLVSFSFAFAFLLGESFGVGVVSAQTTVTGPGANLVRTYEAGIPGSGPGAPPLTSAGGAQLAAGYDNAALVEAVKASTEAQTQAINALTTKLGEQQAALAQAQAAGLQDSVAALNTEISGLQNEISGLKESVAGLEKTGTDAAAKAAAEKTAAVGGKPAPGTLTSLFQGNALGTQSGAAMFGGALISGLIWGGIAGTAAYFLAGMFGLNKDQAASVGLGVGGGVFTGTTLYFWGQNIASVSGAQAVPWVLTPIPAALIGIGVGAAIVILTYKKTKRELVHFECLPWEPPRGGSNCEVCNENPYMPCSEYRCKSLGAGCELVNKGTTEELCIWVHKGDTAAPHMTPWEEVLPEGFRYIPDPTISPPNRGFKILDSEGDECLPAFAKLEFGVTTDEPAQCKIDYQPKTTFDEMQFLFGETNLFLYNHTQRIKVPKNEEEGGEGLPEIGIDGTFTLWARCIDANGNGADSAMVAFRYCVDPAPDITQPVIEDTSIQTGSFVRFNVDSVPIEVYVNEPAECKWSRQDKDFDSMENEMECASETYQINSNLDYVCRGSLTGIENRAENWFYFRCRDYSDAPGGRNTMTTSYPLLLQGSEELTIVRVGPTGVFTGSTSVIPVNLEVETAHGSENGKAVCQFTTTPTDGSSFIEMENTDSYLHNQSLDLTAGQHFYYFRCFDSGGNSVEANTNFTVQVDTQVPSVIRVYRDGTNLKVLTNEEAKCYYSQNNCNFNSEEGLAFTYEDPTKRTVHVAPWDEGITYYIKCEDFQSNQPRPDFCHIIVKASEL